MSVHGNLYDDDWDDPYPTPEGWRSHFKHLGGRELALGLYELLPGQTQCPYHFHYGNHEALVVLAGAPTLRTPDGERVLGAGDVEYFPAGPDGAHQVVNRTGDPVRYFVLARHVDPEIVEQVDSGKLLAMSRTRARGGRPLFSVHRVDETVDYFDGEGDGA